MVRDCLQATSPGVQVLRLSAFVGKQLIGGYTMMVG
jgi:hypothetical protein